MLDKQKKETISHWLSLLIVPLVLLFLGWWYTNRVEQRALDREIRKERIEVLSQIIQHQWLNRVAIEEIHAAETSPEYLQKKSTPEYLQAKRTLNETYSLLYVDKLKVEILFQNEMGKQLSEEVRAYIRYGGNDEELKKFAETGQGNIKESEDKLSKLTLQLLKDTTQSKYLKTEW